MKVLCTLFVLFISVFVWGQVYPSHITDTYVDVFWTEYQTKGSPDVVVAVFGQGVDVTHPALAGKIFEGKNIYDDNFNLMPFDPNTSDGHHETHVAGIIAGAHNTIKTSIAPDCKNAC